MSARILNIALGFVREHTPESCARLCAVLCGVTGCTNVLGSLVFALLHPHEGATVQALASNTFALIGGGMVAVLARKRKPDPDPDAAAAGALSLPTPNSNSRLPSLVAVEGGAR